jgi:hypothetical protein
MHRLIPDSLLGRVMLIFIAGFSITVIAMLLAQLPEREAANLRISAGRAAHRLTDFLKLTDQLPAANRNALAEVARARGVQIEFTGRPAADTVRFDPADIALFHELLLDNLGRDRSVVVAVKPVEKIPREPGQSETTDGFQFEVRAPLSDGTWVNTFATAPAF